MADFDDGAALIFGASGGIGAGVTRAFARAGSAVALVHHSRPARAELLAAELAAGGIATSTHGADAREADAVTRAVEAASAAHGGLHTLVWAAGPIVPQLHLAEISAAQYRHAFEVETFGFFNAVQAVLPRFRARGGGAIVHLGSAGHGWWPPRDGLSVAPKAANEALIRGIAKEEGRHGIRANSLLIGVIDAGMFHELSAQGAFGPDWVAETQKLIPLRRWGSAEEVGEAAVFLASSRAGYITGQAISVSGGFGV